MRKFSCQNNMGNISDNKFIDISSAKRTNNTNSKALDMLKEELSSLKKEKSKLEAELVESRNKYQKLINGKDDFKGRLKDEFDRLKTQYDKLATDKLKSEAHFREKLANIDATLR